MVKNTQSAKRIFFDINIVVDLLDSKRNNHELTKKLIRLLYENDYKIAISEDMLSTIFYIVKDKKAVLNFFKVVLDSWLVLPFGEKIINHAIEISLQKKLDFEDVLQCLCAKENGCDCLITHDNNFVDCGLKVHSTQEYFALINN